MRIIKNEKHVIKIIIIIMILGIILWLCKEKYAESIIENKKDSKYEVTDLSIQNAKEEEQIEIEKVTKEYPKEDIIEKYKNYYVEAKLTIPKISLETYILEKYSIDALNISVTKFWGADSNEIGNFCVAGHNFQNRNMFHNLKNLNLGDKMFILNRNIGKIEYEVFDIYKVDPEDVSCLDQETNGKREVTLITCTNDSKKRIIVKAREVDL